VAAPALFAAVSAAAPRKMHTFSPQELSNLAWAFATAKVDALRLFDSIESECIKQILLFKPQDLSNIVWAFATAGVTAPDLFSAINSRLQPNLYKVLNTFKSQHLATLAQKRVPSGNAKGFTATGERGPDRAAGAETGSGRPETRGAGFPGMRVEGRPVHPRVWPWPEPEPDPRRRVWSFDKPATRARSTN